MLDGPPFMQAGHVLLVLECERCALAQMLNGVSPEPKEPTVQLPPVSLGEFVLTDELRVDDSQPCQFVDLPVEARGQALLGQTPQVGTKGGVVRVAGMVESKRLEGVDDLHESSRDRVPLELDGPRDMFVPAPDRLELVEDGEVVVSLALEQPRGEGLVANATVSPRIKGGYVNGGWLPRYDGGQVGKLLAVTDPVGEFDGRRTGEGDEEETGQTPPRCSGLAGEVLAPHEQTQGLSAASGCKESEVGTGRRGAERLLVEIEIQWVLGHLSSYPSAAAATACRQVGGSDRQCTYNADCRVLCGRAHGRSRPRNRTCGLCGRDTAYPRTGIAGRPRRRRGRQAG